MLKAVPVILGLLGALTVTLGSPAAPAAGTLAGYKVIVLDGVAVKWGTPSFGQGAVVTYAIATEPASFPGARNCSGIVAVDGLLFANKIEAFAFAAAVREAFRVWSDAADIQFVATDQSTADIIIGAEAAPRGRAFTNVSRIAGAGGDGPAPLQSAVICLNPAEPWKLGFDGDLEIYDLRYVLTHEIGHAIGLDHPGVPGELMDFRYREEFAGLQAGDRAGVVALYGARPANVATAVTTVPSQ